MEATSKPSTSREASDPPPSAHPTDRAPPNKRVKTEIIVPSSPSKSRTYYQRPPPGTIDKEQEVRRQASLLSYAEARAKASSHYNAADDTDADFKYPPGSSGDSSARGLLEQIKNRMDQRAPPKPSNFLQKAKQVQQSLLDKQQQKLQIQKARQEAEKRESMRSSGFGDQPARLFSGPASQAVVDAEPTDASLGAFTRAQTHVDQHNHETTEHEESDGDEAEDGPLNDEEEWDESSEEYDSGEVRRNEWMASLKVGPANIATDPTDPKWERMEPFSRHKMRERKIDHGTLKEHLRGRYHVSSSMIYALARPISMGRDGAALNPLRNGDYEMPINGDWITIATIVEKSEIMVTKGFKVDAPTPRVDHDDPVLFKDASDANGRLKLDLEPGNSNAFEASSRKSAKPQQVDEDERTRANINLSNRARKFIIIKLVDLDVSDDSLKGHNQLQLIAYESDVIDTSIVRRNTSIRSEVSAALSATSTKKYINGSKGAFELLAAQSEGTVIAIMNPKVYKPYTPKVGMRDDKMYRISPRSAEDCLIIGQAADFRRCEAIKANGTRCGSFVDAKNRRGAQAMVCSYHLNLQMASLLRGRPEFATNATSTFGGGAQGEAYRGANSYAKNALAKKLNSSYGHVGDGMENNGGQIYTSAVSLPETKASDPSSWKYDVNARYGRGHAEKRSRLKKAKEEEMLAAEIERRFGAPRERKPLVDDDDAARRDGANKDVKLPILPNGSANLIQTAYSTLDQRRQKAAAKQAAEDARKRKLTGVVSSTPHPSTPDTAASAKLQFQSLPTTKHLAANLFPINGLSTPKPTTTGRDSRSTLLNLASSSTTKPTAAEPSLKIRKQHRPKLRLPPSEQGKQSFAVVAGELIHLDDLADDAWEADLAPPDDKHPPSGQPNLSDRILQLNPHQDSDSDLEII